MSYGKPIDIPINGGKLDTVFRKQKSPELVPIVAVCYPESGVVILSFSRNVGEIDVELWNSSIGEYASYIVSSKNGGATLPFSGTCGHYSISLILESGKEYSGEFFVEDK